MYQAFGQHFQQLVLCDICRKDAKSACITEQEMMNKINGWFQIWKTVPQKVTHQVVDCKGQNFNALRTEMYRTQSAVR
jgi:hypothetical protein